ncbi:MULTISPECIES: very short patch repair endonuclease [unclassified Nocardioides]|uniref:very short patch repair endonuclease n=1 Tax=unclassified Nocardioides TaxID=2615069 RepID=UPI0009EADB4E|nr:MULTISPECIES: very short patch repair endonuclease [unclassified Nocardioides]
MPGEDGPTRIRLGVSNRSYSVPPTPDAPVSPAARRTMLANKRRDTGPELAVRSILHRAGMRFRVDHPLPFAPRRRADIVFTRAGLYVFIDGCFWHGCPEHFVMPRTRSDFWQNKIDGNRDRDRDTEARIRALGLTSLRIWEHVPPVEAASLVVQSYRDCLNRERMGLGSS